MSFGISVFDGAGVQTLGMEDFTLQKLAVMTIPKNPSGNTPRPAPRTDYILMDVPGYDPSSCFVIITPKVYAGYDQPGYPDGWGYTPTYKDLGGTRIAIYTYANRRMPNGTGGWIEQWVENSVECVVEVVRVA